MSAIGATAPARRRSVASSPAPTRSTQVAEPAGSGARLTVVASRPTPADRMPFAVLVGGILLAGLMGLLLVHTLAAQESFRVHDLTQRLATLQDEEQGLAVGNQHAATPASLRSEAIGLGMRPSTIGDYHRMKDGRVVGTLTAIPVAVPAAPATSSTKSTSATAKSAKSTKAGTSAKPGKHHAATRSGATTPAASKRAAHHHKAGHTGASAH